mmetsp:Transcript_98803/g.195914  ORF Transcript_98803/g.195914 Transcript_98803/m.195914 type:complete len:233 (+) Transcript_98803:497-1195(+)
MVPVASQCRCWRRCCFFSLRAFRRSSSACKSSQDGAAGGSGTSWEFKSAALGHAVSARFSMEVSVSCSGTTCSDVPSSARSSTCKVEVPGGQSSIPKIDLSSRLTLRNSATSRAVSSSSSSLHQAPVTSCTMGGESLAMLALAASACASSRSWRSSRMWPCSHEVQVSSSSRNCPWGKLRTPASNFMATSRTFLPRTPMAATGQPVEDRSAARSSDSAMLPMLYTDYCSLPN